MTPTVRLAAVLLVLSVAGCQSVKRALVEQGIEGRRGEAGLAEREILVDGRRVAYLERPGNGPTVVLLHGFGASKDVWLPFAAELPEGFRVLVPDLPGHGGSERDSTVRYDAERLAESVERWLSAVAPGPVHVAGNSLGGAVAAWLALGESDRVRSLGLFAPAGVASPVPSTLDSLVQGGNRNPLIPTNRGELDRLLDLAYSGDPNIPGPARDVLAAGYERRAPFLRDLFEALATGRDALRPRLPEIDEPVLLVWGAEDRILDVSAAEVWAAGLPNETRAVYPETGHAPMSERPADAARAFAALVRGAAQ